MARGSKAFDHSKYKLWIDPNELVPYEKNAKVHTDKQIKNIVNSINRFGWQQDVVITTDNVLVIGHGRRLAAIKIGCEVPYHVIDKTADELTDKDIRELRIADNKTNSETGYDFDLMNVEIEDLDFEGFDFDFDIGGVATDTSTTTEDDYEPELPEQPRAKLGDIYQLGKHRLMCGSSTDIDNVAELMDGESAKMLFTSPPYSDMREYEGGKDLSVENLAQFIPAYRPYTDYQCVNLGIQRKNNDVYEYWDEYKRVARESGYKLLAWNVWDKMLTGNIGQASAFFPLRHEFIFVFGTEFFEINLTVEKKPESIVENPKMGRKRNADGSMSEHTKGDTSKTHKQMESVLTLLPELGTIRQLHPATFPVGLPAEYIKAMTMPEDAVIEPFGGSGTTMIACEQLNRTCYMMELDPKYIDVIIDRWEKLTGEKAVLLNG